MKIANMSPQLQTAHDFNNNVNKVPRSSGPELTAIKRSCIPLPIAFHKSSVDSKPTKYVKIRPSFETKAENLTPESSRQVQRCTTNPGQHSTHTIYQTDNDQGPKFILTSNENASGVLGLIKCAPCNRRSIHSYKIPSQRLSEDSEKDSQVPYHLEGNLRLELKKSDQEQSSQQSSRTALTAISQHNSCLFQTNDDPCTLINLSRRVAETANRARGYFLCPICSEPFEKPAVIACGHLFCMRCVYNWFEDQDNCPCCRYRIIGKEAISVLIAKELAEVHYLLASVFNAGNLHTLMDSNEMLSNDLEKISSSKILVNHTCRISEEIMSSHLAPIFSRLFLPRNNDTTTDKEMEGISSDTEKKYVNCLKSALWFVRHAALLTPPLIKSVEQEHTTEPSSLVQNLPKLIRNELVEGSEQSREDLLIKVMRIRQRPVPKVNACFSIPSVLPTLSEGKLRTSDGFHRRRWSTLRFRLPPLEAFLKMLVMLSAFVVLGLVFNGMDDKTTRLATSNSYKIDFFVYALTMCSFFVFFEDRNNGFRRGGRNINAGAGISGREERNLRRSNS